MAPRRSVKTVCISNNNSNYSNLTFTDVLCPICRSILIEPVTLPCNHGFCSSCFDGTVANANLVCPLCRVRIGSWMRRTSKKNKKLVNSVFWEAIQRDFPVQVKNKLEGCEDYPEEDTPRPLTRPGEIRREYEIQKAKELLDLQNQHNNEAKASEDYIRELKKQEEYEENIRQANLRLSEQVARKLSQEYSFDPGPSSSKVKSLSSKCSLKKQQPIDGLLRKMAQKKLSVTVEPVIAPSASSKEYTCKILCQDRNKEFVKSHSSMFDKSGLLNWKIQDKLKKIATEGEASDSNDSIVAECRYFKPIDQRHIPLPIKVPVIKVPAIVSIANTVIIGPPKGEMHFSHAQQRSAFAVVRNMTFILNISEDQNVHKSNNLVVEDDATQLSEVCDTTLIEISPTIPSTSADVKSPKRRKTQNLEVLQTSPCIRKHGTRNKAKKSPSKTPEKSKDLTSFSTPSKRLRSSVALDKEISPKRKRISMVSDVNSPPFFGFDNSNLNELKAKTNGAIALGRLNGSMSLKADDSDIKADLKKIQEDEDLKFALKLQEELNSKGRYSTRNSISSSVKTKNVRKSTARQVTLKEIISQSSKVP